MGDGRRVVVLSATGLVLALLLMTTGVGCARSVADGTQFGFVHEVSGAR